MNRKIYALLCAMLILSGCRLTPPYRPPVNRIPDEWKHTEQENQEPITSEDDSKEKELFEEKSQDTVFLDYWWEVFEDDALNELERLAVSNSPTLETAIQKVYEARSLAIVEASNLYPQITLDPSYLDSMQLFQIFLPPGQLFPAGGSNIAPFRIHQFQYVLPLTLNYEVDLFGKLKSRYESAVYQFQATQFDYLSIMLTLTCDLASNYFQARSLDAQIKVLAELADLQKQSLALAKSRFSKGLVNLQSVADAEAVFANAEQALLDAERQRSLLENMIGSLIGIPASEYTLAASPLITLPPSIPAGLPSELLLRRPDIAQAERKNASEYALIGAAYASFFPTLSLSGILGFSSPNWNDFLKWKSRYWQIGASSTQDVYNAGRNQGNVEVAIARFRQTSADYQQTVITAFREVEDSLSNLGFEFRQYKALEKATDATGVSARLSKQRYLGGLVNQIEAIQGQNTYLNSELSRLSNIGLQYVSTVQFIKALGGGWGCVVY